MVLNNIEGYTYIRAKAFVDCTGDAVLAALCGADHWVAGKDSPRIMPATLPSLFAGKLHALLARPYAKGRDWFDLVWYLTEKRGLEPNVKLLGNALAQTKLAIEAVNWRAAVAKKLRSLKWSAVLTDLRPFVERQSDLEMIEPKAIEKLLVRDAPLHGDEG